MKSGSFRYSLKHYKFLYISCRNYAACIDDNKFTRSIEMHLKLENGLELAKELRSAEKLQLKSLPKRTWGSVFFILNQTKEFKALDELKQRAFDLKIDCGEGALSTMIKSYTERNQPLNAANLLHELKSSGLLRHTRSYISVITSLAKNGYCNRAFELFHEMNKQTFKSNQTISLKIPSKMASALILSCIGCELSGYGKAIDVLEWYNVSGQQIDKDVFKAISQWLQNDPINTWVIKECEISKHGLCNHCGKSLHFGSLSISEKDNLKKNILKAIKELFALNEKTQKKLLKYDEFLEQSCQCDVIIDGMSIGLSTNAKKKERKKRFNFDALQKLSSHFVNQGHNVLVVLNNSVKKNFFKGCLVQFCDVGDDDLFIIYASAFWNLEPFIVTRDKYREHRFLLETPNVFTYLKWLRSHFINVGFEGNIKFYKRNFDNVLQYNNSSWHFPLLNGEWFCATKL